MIASYKGHSVFSFSCSLYSDCIF